MKKLIASAVLSMAAVPAFADCGEVSITEMNWASSSVVTNVAKFLMEQGYGCTVTAVPSDTTPAVTSLAENGEPDIATEMWTNSAGQAYEKILAEGKIKEVGQVLDPGGVEGWWIPSYLAEAHPELKTIEGVLANPELVGGVFNNCPDGWGCRIANDNLIPAFGVKEAGIKVFDHGSGETLATSLAAAYEKKEPWFGYYWAPTSLLGKYEMVSVDLGEYNAENHAANAEADNPKRGKTSFPDAPVYTVVTADFADREPEIAELMSKMTFKVSTMGSVLAWMDENTASAEEGAVYFIKNHSDEWAGWLNDEARAKLAKLIK